MNEDLALLLTEVRAYLFSVFPVFLRVGGVMALMPAFGEQAVPARIKLVLALAFTLVVTAGIDQPIAAFRPEYLSEVLVGLLIGIMLRLFILALQTAGTMIAQSISLAQMFGGTDGQPQPAVGNLLTIGALALATHMGLHVKVAALMIGSYNVLPIGALPSGELVMTWGVGQVTQTFRLGFSIAMPFILAGLVYNVALGAINRAMPQLMVSFVGAPALTAGGLILLALAAPSGLALWLGAFDDFLANPFVVAR